LNRLVAIICIVMLLGGCGVRHDKPEEETPQAQPPASAPAPTATTLPDEAGPEETPPPLPSPQKTPAPEKSQAPDLQPPLPSPSIPAPPEVTAKVTNTVKISITGDSENADILPQTEVEFEEGQTVFDILLKVAKERQIQIEFRGSKKNAYIRGIDNLYEFDKGGQSGWVYSVNGVFPRKSCGAYTIKAGDVIELKYTTKIGEYQF
jgi:hypothetical protein